jgi:hypothetical protein
LLQRILNEIRSQIGLVYPGEVQHVWGADSHTQRGLPFGITSDAAVNVGDAAEAYPTVP